MELIQSKSSASKPSKSENEEIMQVSTWTQCAWFTTGCTTVLISLTKALLLTAATASTAPRPWLRLTLAALLGYLLSDLITGIYHWGIDNYGNPKTSIFGSHIEAFEEHHIRPWLITKAQLASNLYQPAAATTVIGFPINLFSGDPAVLGFVGVFAFCLILGQQFHAWAHTPKGKLPRVVVVLQDVGIILGRGEHAAHHRGKYNSNYCMISGVCNRALDKSKLFVGLEMILFTVVGVSPRSWTGQTVVGDESITKTA